MEKIPTAREFYDAHDSDDAVVMMRDFAKMHVEAALKAASDNAKIIDVGIDYSIVKLVVEKDSITNSYPLENIK